MYVPKGKKGLRAAIMMALGATAGFGPALYRAVCASAALRFARACINCSPPHRHNQPWCSANCCDEWRLENPNQGRDITAEQRNGALIR